MMEGYTEVKPDTVDVDMLRSLLSTLNTLVKGDNAHTTIIVRKKSFFLRRTVLKEKVVIAPGLEKFFFLYVDCDYNAHTYTKGFTDRLRTLHNLFRISSTRVLLSPDLCVVLDWFNNNPEEVQEVITKYGK